MSHFIISSADLQRSESTYLTALSTKQCNVTNITAVCDAVNWNTGKLALADILKMAVKPVSCPAVIVIIQSMCVREGLFQKS